MNARRLPGARRRPRWLAVLAVAVLGLRALIPTGYMIAAVDGSARLVVCPAGIHHASGMHGAGHASFDADHCPYAFSGGAGLLPALPESQPPYFATLGPARAPAIESVPAPPPARFRAPRGPPSLA